MCFVWRSFPVKSTNKSALCSFFFWGGVCLPVLPFTTSAPFHIWKKGGSFLPLAEGRSLPFGYQIRSAETSGKSFSFLGHILNQMNIGHYDLKLVESKASSLLQDTTSNAALSLWQPAHGPEPASFASSSSTTPGNQWILLGFLSVEPCPQGARCQWHPLFFFAAKGFPFKPQPAKQSRCPVFLVATLSKIRAGHMHSHYRVTQPPAAQGGMIAPGSGEFSVSSVESDLGLCDMGSKHFALLFSRAIRMIPHGKMFGARL